MLIAYAVSAWQSAILNIVGQFASDLQIVAYTA